MMARNILRTGKQARPKTAVKGKRYRGSRSLTTLFGDPESAFEVMGFTHRWPPSSSAPEHSR
jgi:hypothetical protein